MQRHTANEDFSEYIVERLEMCTRNVSSLIHLQLNATDEAAGDTILRKSTRSFRVLEKLREWQDHNQLRSITSYHASCTQSVPSQLGGRPRFDISGEQLQYLRSTSFTWVQTSEILGVSHMTIYRQR